MTTSTTGGPATRSDSTPEERCTFYRNKCRLPAVVDPATQRILLPVGGLVGAITMPLHLGRRVLAGLRIRMLAGPVVERPHIQRWTFITGPGHDLDEVVSADLLRLGASVAAQGDNLVLPTPEDERIGLWRWECVPQASGGVPPQSAVIATTRAMATSTVQ
ncbi:hypothetical protein BS330_39045 [Amycolatopsis keratiniphila subsp. nogabecina]|nr:hypothetical protein BS330_39045 [Amycolatopsis keratiniphila subsp. nogabecina]TWE14968.1 hypothetical protein FHX69_7134 [Prauserella muralis]SDU62933.1 hypothetical protein SAMN04489733_7305 [Amycolatopsis keratiniphila]